MPQPTALPPHTSPELVAAQTNALGTLLRLIDAHPELPGAYFVSHCFEPQRVDVQLDSPSALEAWREALNLPTDAIEPKAFPDPDRRELEVSAVIGTATIRVYAIFTPAHDASRESA
nr:hypothetical protein OH826_32855 [Streptomyces sp. NBC_00899]